MERLTRWSDETEGAELVEYDHEEWKDLFAIDNMDILDSCSICSAINKLADYEDTGLTPEEVTMLQKDRKYWMEEARKWASKLGEIRIWAKLQECERCPREDTHCCKECVK